MNYLNKLSITEIKKINGGKEVMTGYPGQSLVNFIWSTLSAAYQKGYDDKALNIVPCE